MTTLYVGGEHDILALDVSSDPPRVLQQLRIGAMPSFLCFAPTRRRAYVALENEDLLAALVLGQDGTLTLAGTTACPGGPAYLSVDRSERWLFAASYGSGELRVFPLDESGNVGAATSCLHAGTFAHAAVTSPDNRRLYVPCKGDDEIVEFDFSSSTGEVTLRARISCPPGTGPRHLIFESTGERAFVSGENACSLPTLRKSADRFAVESVVSTLPRARVDGDSGAHLELSEDERFLYFSNRGHDSIAVFSLEEGGAPRLLELVPSAAAFPRHFSLTREAVWVAGQKSATLARFERDPESGRIGQPRIVPLDQGAFWVGMERGPSTP